MFDGPKFHVVVGLLEAGAAWYFFEAARSRETIRIRPWMALAGGASAAFFALWHLNKAREERARAVAAPTPGPTAPTSNPQTFPTPTTPVN